MDKWSVDWRVDWLVSHGRNAKWHLCQLELPDEILKEAQIFAGWLVQLPERIHLRALCGYRVGIQWLSPRVFDEHGHPILPPALICRNCRRRLEAEAANLREAAKQYEQLRTVFEFWREQGVIR